MVVAETDFSVRMFEAVRVGPLELLGEVVRIRSSEAEIQVCDDTTGLRVGEEVLFTRELLGVELGPGLLGQVLDGAGRPAGGPKNALPEGKVWRFIPSVGVGDPVGPGDILGTVPEGTRFLHRVLCPLNAVGGRVAWVAREGDRSVRECVCRLEDGTELALSQRREVRIPRRGGVRLPLDRPLFTGQRVLDTLFPLAVGGVALLSGEFGTGKTVMQQALARCCAADVVVCVSCGERGNETAEIMERFSTLTAPCSGAPLMERTILIANPSNMPPAGRDVAVCLGMTAAEYYRDMGYGVLVLIDSLSRWAEALRQERHPADLDTRLARICERAGRMEPLGRPSRQGSVTIVGAVSPWGGDFSDPVTQTALRLSGASWRLDKNLARSRRFPAIDRSASWSLYALTDAFVADASVADASVGEAGEDWPELKEYLKSVMLRARELEDVRRAGRTGLSEEDKWVLYHAESLKVLYLQQSACDAASFPKRSAHLLRLLKALDGRARKAINSGLSCGEIASVAVRPPAALHAVPKASGTSEKDLPAGVEEWLALLNAKLADGTGPAGPEKAGGEA
jgi:V/A-type H+-transporting ATPase subunit A